jgi:uncharacterized protein (TIGR02145 family)
MKTKLITTLSFGLLLGSACPSLGQEKASPPQTYKSVKIGKQEWMAENLSVTRFRNGDPIPEAKTDEEWVKKKPAWCYYNNDPENGKKYGRLYNWFALTDKRGLAPQGWHIPTAKEWEALGAALGGIDVAGPKLKSATGWKNKSTNETGFSALPGGLRYETGQFSELGSMELWWGSTENDPTGNMGHSLNGQNDWLGFFEGKANQTFGFSVRCVKDKK